MVVAGEFLGAMAAGAGLGANGVNVPLIGVGIAFSLIAFGSALMLKQALGAPSAAVGVASLGVLFVLPA